MTFEEIDFLQKELTDYVLLIGDGKWTEETANEIRIKITQLNELIDTYIDEQDIKTSKYLTDICYQYYRLLYY